MKWVLSRLQRLSLATLLTGGVVAAAGVAVLVMAVEPPPAVPAGAASTTATATPSAEAAASSSELAAPTPPAPASDTPSPSDSSTPAVSPSASTTVRPTSTARPSASPSGTSDSTPQASPVAAPADCQATDMQVTIKSDRSVYTSGQAVTFTMTARNAGSSACRDHSNTCMDPVTVSDSNGNVVWTSTHPGAGMCPYPASTDLLPGASVSYTYQWDQHTCTPSACPGPMVPSGTYSAQGRWQFASGDLPSNRITVDVAAA